jgi:hypothetical protein
MRKGVFAAHFWSRSMKERTCLSVCLSLILTVILSPTDTLPLQNWDCSWRSGLMTDLAVSPVLSFSQLSLLFLLFNFYFVSFALTFHVAACSRSGTLSRIQHHDYYRYYNYCHHHHHHHYHYYYGNVVRIGSCGEKGHFNKMTYGWQTNKNLHRWCLLW